MLTLTSCRVCEASHKTNPDRFVVWWGNSVHSETTWPPGSVHMQLWRMSWTPENTFVPLCSVANTGVRSGSVTRLNICPVACPKQAPPRAACEGVLPPKLCSLAFPLDHREGGWRFHVKQQPLLLTAPAPHHPGRTLTSPPSCPKPVIFYPAKTILREYEALQFCTLIYIKSQ